MCRGTNHTQVVVLLRQQVTLWVERKQARSEVRNKRLERQHLKRRKLLDQDLEILKVALAVL